MPSTAPAIKFDPAGVADEKTVAWLIGTNGEWDWQHIIARDEHQAILGWLDEAYSIECKCKTSGTEERECSDEPPCEYCERYRELDVQRVKRWDGKDYKEITGADWLRAGMGAYCARCDEATSFDECGHVVNEFVYCEGCMQIEDGEWVDSEYAEDLKQQEKERERRYQAYCGTINERSKARNCARHAQDSRRAVSADVSGVRTTEAAAENRHQG